MEQKADTMEQTSSGMGESRKINIFTNGTEISRETRHLLKRKLEKSGYVVPRTFDPESELIFCIGGDGSFLKALHKYGFPPIPFVGVNTGHLGFFQELHPDELDEFIFKYQQSKYNVQKLKTVSATVQMETETIRYRALNEIIIKGDHSQSVHLNLSIGDSYIERFSGDGILVATPAGSTAYNYALGGSIVDPRLNLLQITPIAPMNTTAYRSFLSSVMLPSELSVTIYPEYVEERGVMIVTDGLEHKRSKIIRITIDLSDESVQLLRFEHYDFWNKVKSKFL